MFSILHCGLLLRDFNTDIFTENPTQKNDSNHFNWLSKLEILS